MIFSKPTKRLINFRPIFIISLSLVLGIFLGYFANRGNKLIFGISVIGLCGLILYIFLTKRKNKTIFILSLLLVGFITIFFILGFGLINLKLNNFEKSDFNDGKFYVSGTVKDFDIKEHTIKLVLKDVNVRNDFINKAISEKVSITVSYENSIEIERGYRADFYGKLSKNEIEENGRINAKNLVDNIKYKSFISSKNLNMTYAKPNFFDSINIKIRNILRENMSEDEYSLSYALLLGKTYNVDYDILSEFRFGGIAHIFAVSGLHIGFLCVALTFALKKIKIKKIIKSIIIIGTLYFYSGVCGFSSSSLRASTMCACLILCNNFGVKYDSLNSVAISLLVVLTYNVLFLFDVGFILSYSAVFCIIILTPVFLKLIKLLKIIPKGLSQSLAVVLSAQIGLIPILIYFFNGFTFIGILLNLIFLPVISVIFTCLIAGVFISMIFPFLQFILFVPEKLMLLVKYLMIIGDMERFFITSFTFGGFVGIYYIFLLINSYHINLKKWLRNSVSIIVSVVLISGILTSNLPNKNIEIQCVGERNVNVAMLKTQNNHFSMLISDFSKSYLPQSLIKKIYENKVKVIDNIIFLKNSKDYKFFLDKLSTYVEIKEVRYPFNEDYYENKSSLQNYKALAILSNDKVVMEEFEIIYREDLFSPLGALIKINDKNIMYSSIKDFKKMDKLYRAFEEDYDVIIAEKFYDSIRNHYDTPKLVGFNDDDDSKIKIPTTWTNGCLIFKL